MYKFMFSPFFLNFFSICFIMSQKGNRQKNRYNIKDNNEKKFIIHSVFEITLET